MASRILAVIVLIFFVSGCATTGTRKTAQAGDGASQIASLEARVADNERTIDYLQAQLSGKGSSGADYSYSGKSAPPQVAATPRRIQQALQNAGYYEGNIDGKIGRLSLRAIKEFQIDKGLKVDGVVGKETWAKLAAYLD